MADKCQAKRLGLVDQRCRYPITVWLGDESPVGLCAKCWELYLKIVEHNPEEADRIRKKVGMKHG